LKPPYLVLCHPELACGELACGELACGELACGELACGELACGELACGELVEPSNRRTAEGSIKNSPRSGSTVKS